MGGNVGERSPRTLVVTGGVLLLAAIATVLAHASSARTGTNGLRSTAVLGGSVGRVVVCQSAERLPAGTGAVQLSLSAARRAGPRVAVVASDGGAPVAHGTLAAGWRGDAATVSLRPVTRTPRSVRLCVAIGAEATVVLRGQTTVDASEPPATTATSQLAGRLHVEYLGATQRSWWSRAPAIVTRLGFGHAIRGAWVGLLALLLMLGAGGFALALLLREG